MTRAFWIVGTALGLLFGSLAAGCGTPVDGGRGVDTTALAKLGELEYPQFKPSRHAGKFIYQQYCAECHGMVGPAPTDPKFALTVPGQVLDPTFLAKREENFLAYMAEQRELGLVPDVGHPPKQGDYVDLYDYTYYKNGSNLSFDDPAQNGLADMTYREAFEVLSEPHGEGTDMRDFKKALSDTERWAVTTYVMNISLDNGRPDWKQNWDKQIGIRKDLYGTHCSICHGQVGRADGPEGHHLEPKPINYNQLDWQAGVRPGYPVTNSYIYDIIANGKIKPGSNSVWTGMPWWKDQLRESDMYGLTDFVRSLSYEWD